MRNARGKLLNVLTIFVLVATICLASFYGLVALGVYEIFPPPTPVPVAQLPTDTPTPVDTPIPTWTPTPLATGTPTGPPTDTPGPTLTPSSTPTLPPTATPLPTDTPVPPPTDTPTITPTPGATRSVWPFTHEVTFKSPPYERCNWTGVAGYVQDLDGNPLPGYPIHIWGGGIDEVVIAGADPRFNTIYGSQAAWEQFFAPSPKVIEIHVQLHDPFREGNPPASDEIVIELPGTCDQALAFVVLTQNH